jgi:hypothetical protein
MFYHSLKEYLKICGRTFFPNHFTSSSENKVQKILITKNSTKHLTCFCRSPPPHSTNLCPYSLSSHIFLPSPNPTKKHHKKTNNNVDKHLTLPTKTQQTMHPQNNSLRECKLATIKQNKQTNKN